MTPSPFYLTTAIAYPNGDPHIGHAYEYIASDVIARFKRLDGYDVFFMTGTDEHGQKMQQTAEKVGLSAKELADRQSAQFKKLDAALNISYDRFIRTTDADHKVASQAIWKAMEETGDIYLGTYSGWYSVRDEAFVQEDETEVDESGNRRTITTGTPVEWAEEQTYFFKLSAYQDRLLELYEQHPEFIAPESRRNEIISFVKSGLSDLSISRTTFDWGIPVPDSAEHVMYVWVDALTNYLTGVGYPDQQADSYRKWWPADVHMIGKDIIRFHAVYWPAFLLSAGLPLPKRVFAHGFLFNKGEKMSKSLGNVVDPFSLIDTFGVDTVRYFFLREVPFGQDGNYSQEGIISRMNSDLANDLGNLAQRSLSMVAKNVGSVPVPGGFSAEDQELLSAANGLLALARGHIDAQALHSYLETVWKVISDTNKYFTQQEPWVLRKTDPERMQTVLYVTLEVLRIVGILIQPVVPSASSKLLDFLGQTTDQRSFDRVSQRIEPGVELPSPEAIFPRFVIDDDKVPSA